MQMRLSGFRRLVGHVSEYLVTWWLLTQVRPQDSCVRASGCGVLDVQDWCLHERFLERCLARQSFPAQEAHLTAEDEGGSLLLFAAFQDLPVQVQGHTPV